MKTIFSAEVSVSDFSQPIIYVYAWPGKNDQPIHYGGLFAERPKPRARRKIAKMGALYLIRITFKAGDRGLARLKALGLG